MNELTAPLKRIFIEAHRELRPGAAVPEIHAEFFPAAGLNHTIRRRSGRLSARVSDVLQDAPAEVIRLVASILLARLYRQRIDATLHERYRRYILDEEVQRRARDARRERGRAVRGTAHGKHINLESAFDRLNERFFRGELIKPILTWSRVPARRRLAHYDAAKRVISISSFFDSPHVPRHVTDYVLFHEMLHMNLAATRSGSRLITHSREFRAAEQAFPSYETANSWLDSALGANGTIASSENLPAGVQSKPFAGVIQR